MTNVVLGVEYLQYAGYSTQVSNALLVGEILGMVDNLHKLSRSLMNCQGK